MTASNLRSYRVSQADYGAHAILVTQISLARQTGAVIEAMLMVSHAIGRIVGLAAHLDTVSEIDYPRAQLVLVSLSSFMLFLAAGAVIIRHDAGDIQHGSG